MRQVSDVRTVSCTALAVLCFAVVLTGCESDNADTAVERSTAAGTSLTTPTETTPTESSPTESTASEPPSTEPRVIRTARDAEALLGTTMGLLEPHCDESGEFDCRFVDSAGTAYVACVHAGEVGYYYTGIVGWSLPASENGTGSDLCLERGLGDPLSLPAPLAVKAQWLIAAYLGERNQAAYEFDCKESRHRTAHCHVEGDSPTQPNSDFAYDMEVVCDSPAANALCTIEE